MLCYPRQERQQFAAVTALSNEGEDKDTDGYKSGVEPTSKKDTAVEGKDDDSTNKVVSEPTTSPEKLEKKADTQSGWYVLMEVQVHVSSGLHIKMTDLDVAVLQGIATSLIDSLGVGTAGAASSPAKAGNESAAGKSLTYALDKAQRRMVASLRQAFRLADVNGDGTLDRAEVEGTNKTRYEKDVDGMHGRGHQISLGMTELR